MNRLRRLILAALLTVAGIFPLTSYAGPGYTPPLPPVKVSQPPVNANQPPLINAPMNLNVNGQHGHNHQPAYPATDGANLVIGGVAMVETDANYHRYIKHLTVSPQMHTTAAFTGTSVAAIKALENPLRRQIFDAMNKNRTEQFRFATLAKAQENFTMRVEAIRFMFNVYKGPNNGGVDFNYFTPKNPASATLDRARWGKGGPAPFQFKTLAGVRSSEAIDGAVRNPFRGECLGALELTVLQAAKKALGPTRFDQLHPAGLAIAMPGSSATKHTRPMARLKASDLVPGDWVYMKNKDDYNSDLRPNVIPGPWTGENALYMGRYVLNAENQRVYSNDVPRRYSGMGEQNKTAVELHQEVKKGYISLMRQPNTYNPHTISDSDVRWTQFTRLVTGD